MGGPTHNPGQLALQMGVTESGSLRAVRGAVEQATVPVPAAGGSSELASSDVGLIGILAAALADEVASRLVLQLERMPPKPEPLQPAAAGGWLTVDEVSRMARLSHRKVYRALRSDALAGEKVGALWRIRPTAVESWATQARPASSLEAGAAVVPGQGCGRRRGSTATWAFCRCDVVPRPGPREDHLTAASARLRRETVTRARRAPYRRAGPEQS
jgi:excisionase family DNA binding protein